MPNERDRAVELLRMSSLSLDRPFPRTLARRGGSLYSDAVIVHDLVIVHHSCTVHAPRHPHGAQP